MEHHTTIEKVLLYLIYHDDASYSKISHYTTLPYIKAVKIPETKYFESIVFKYLMSNKEEWLPYDYIGIFTYSFERKKGMTIPTVYRTVVNMMRAKRDYDLMTFSFVNTLLGRVMYHKNIIPIFNHTLKKPINYFAVPFFCCNYWVAKKDVMLKYVEFAVEYMANLDDTKDTYLQTLLNADAQYPGSVPAHKLVTLTGFPYYTHHCFIMERLASIYFWLNKARVYRA